MSFCKVEKCRYNKTHVTIGHKCGKCGKYGHGRIECGNYDKLEALACDRSILPEKMRCDVKGCKYAHIHTREGHLMVSPDESKEKTIEYIIKCPLCRTDNKITDTQKKVTGISDTCAVCMSSKAEVYFPECGHVCICVGCAEKMNTKDLGDIIKQSALSVQIVNEAKKIFGTSDGKVYTQLLGGMGCSWFIRRSGKDEPLYGFFMHSDSWGQYGGGGDVPKLNEFTRGYTMIE